MSGALQRASRNATVLRWWCDCSEPFRSAARAHYARELGCPDCELGTYEDFAQDADVLLYLSTHYAHTIEAWEDDQL